jgi:hypothetical protein
MAYLHSGKMIFHHLGAFPPLSGGNRAFRYNENALRFHSAAIPCAGLQRAGALNFERNSM